MRITSGIYRGRTLIAPDGDQTHPMGDREKIALFNRIAPYLSASRVLDLYCGSGALGLESLSRGAQGVTFVDNSEKAIKATRENVAKLDVKSQATVLKDKVANFLAQKCENRFNLILCDPPYDHFYPEDFANVAAWLAADGVFVLSHPGSAPEIPNLVLDSTKSYAKANISLYKPQKP